MKKIISAQPMDQRIVVLRYSSGEALELDFAPIIEQGGVFKSLEDDTIFRQLSVSEDGRYIEWPGGIDFCADALYERARSLSV